MDTQRRGEGRENGKESEMGGDCKERFDSDTREGEAVIADRERRMMTLVSK